MTEATFKSRMLGGENLSGTFLKTPALQLIEIFAKSGMDFIALDAEHSPFDRGTVDACLGMARALGFSCPGPYPRRLAGTNTDDA